LHRCRSIYNHLNDFFQKIIDLNVFSFEELENSNYQPLIYIINPSFEDFPNKPIMDPEESKKLIMKIVEHYNRLGKYEFIPHDIEKCADTSICTVIETKKYILPFGGEAGHYHISITTIPIVKSSIDGSQLRLQTIPIPGLYWIARSQGYENAPIIAHIHSYGGRGKDLFAFVAK